jgi:hypothetical protein
LVALKFGLLSVWNKQAFADIDSMSFYYVANAFLPNFCHENRLAIPILNNDIRSFRGPID